MAAVDGEALAGGIKPLELGVLGCWLSMGRTGSGWRVERPNTGAILLWHSKDQTIGAANGNDEGPGGRKIA